MFGNMPQSPNGLRRLCPLFPICTDVYCAVWRASLSDVARAAWRAACSSSVGPLFSPNGPLEKSVWQDLWCILPEDCDARMGPVKPFL